MSEQSLSVRGGRPQQLSALGALNTEEAAFARHLRDLREDLGMSSSDIVKWLRENEPAAAVDASRLSRFLSGANLPRPELLPALHRLLAGAGRAVEPDRVAEGWSLLYAAARTKGPLVAREYKEAVSGIALEEERVRTAHELAGLREQIDREREHGERIRESLDEAFEQRATTHEQVAELEGELGGVTRRIEELEDLVRQHEAVLRLLRADIDRVRDARRQTAEELEAWRGPGAATPWTDEPMSVARAVAAFRDEGEDRQADRLLALAARDLPVPFLPDLYAAFQELGRPLEPTRLNRSIATQRRAKDLIELTASARVTPSHSPDGPLEVPALWPDRVLVEAGRGAAPRELVLLSRLLKETGRPGEKRHLVEGLKYRVKDRAELAATAEFQDLITAEAPAEGASGPEEEESRRRWFRT
ncbi:hypothetical protein ACGFXC_21265 [Streptomyces sp. NPDC048507]|uniref:hypothetical protein n=1 Tax=Streptomyces sp. NPDC048507 TaxID=3365560 RepID=UPI003714D1A5